MQVSCKGKLQTMRMARKCIAMQTNKHWNSIPAL